MADTGPGSHWVELVRAALWPMVIAVCLYYWVVPIYHVLDLLPNILGRTQKINIGGVELDNHAEFAAPAGSGRRG